MDGICGSTVGGWGGFAWGGSCRGSGCVTCWSLFVRSSILKSFRCSKCSSLRIFTFKICQKKRWEIVRQCIWIKFSTTGHTAVTYRKHFPQHCQHDCFLCMEVTIIMIVIPRIIYTCKFFSFCGINFKILQYKRKFIHSPLSQAKWKKKMNSSIVAPLVSNIALWRAQLYNLLFTCTVSWDASNACSFSSSNNLGSIVPLTSWYDWERGTLFLKTNNNQKVSTYETRTR